MAITAEKYAISLLEAIKAAGDNEENIRQVIRNFIKLLKRHNRLNELKLIIDLLEKILETDESYAFKASLEYAGKTNPAQTLKTILEKKYPEKEIVVKSRKNPELIGGLKLIIAGKEIDSSFKTNLNKVQAKILNT